MTSSRLGSRAVRCNGHRPEGPGRDQLMRTLLDLDQEITASIMGRLPFLDMRCKGDSCWPPPHTAMREETVGPDSHSAEEKE